MKFTPKTDKEISELNLLPVGYYNFDIVSAEEAKTQNGADKLVLQIRTFHDKKHRFIKDNLIESFSEKFKSFFDATGLKDKYQSGELHAHDCIGKTGKLEIVHNPDKNGKFWANVNMYFLSNEKHVSDIPEIIDNEIPF